MWGGWHNCQGDQGDDFNPYDGPSYEPDFDVGSDDEHPVESCCDDDGSSSGDENEEARKRQSFREDMPNQAHRFLQSLGASINRQCSSPGCTTAVLSMVFCDSCGLWCCPLCDSVRHRHYLHYRVVYSLQSGPLSVSPCCRWSEEDDKYVLQDTLIPSGYLAFQPGMACMVEGCGGQLTDSGKRSYLFKLYFGDGELSRMHPCHTGPNHWHPFRSIDMQYHTFCM